MSTGKRDLGKSTQVYILVKTPNSIGILEGQSGLSVNYTNAIEEVASFKKMGEAEVAGASYVESQDGKRSIAISVTTGRLKSADERQIQEGLLNTLEQQEDTTTTIFVGDVSPTNAMFTGKEYEVLIASISNDFPSDSQVTGSIEFTNKGTVKPIAHDGTKTLAAIVLEKFPA